MSSSVCHHKRWSSHLSAVAALLLVFLVGLACGEDEILAPGPHQLAFQLDATFQGAHGGQGISIALVRVSDGSVIAQETGTISATQDPSYSFTPGAVLEDGVSYEVHYWIDSNFGGGTAGVCDPRANDHQWSVALASVSNDVTRTESHDPASTEDVCTTFP